MSKYFSDYFWRNGIPYGKGAVKEEFSSTYKIVMDPYRKHISIEKYAKGEFISVIYDSILLDFRQLKSLEQAAWQRIELSSTPQKVLCLIRNPDDRVLFLETHLFEQERCRECHIHSPHGHFLSVHKMFYTALGDPFNGVMLFDQNEHLVMYKHYEVDPLTCEFTQLTKEEWSPIDCSN